MTIELNNEEANLFVLFRKYQDDFAFLIKGDFFNYKNGEARMNRDHNGILQDIRITTLTNKRKKLDKELKTE